MDIPQNVLRTALLPCSCHPVTGWFRDGCCHVDAQDAAGSFAIRARMTLKLLKRQIERGKDLGIPRPVLGPRRH